MPEVSVVIPTRGRPQVVLRTLEAVLRDPATTEAIVVVDGDDPETDEALRPYVESDSRVRVTHAPAASAPRAGEQRVRDHGARVARCEVVMTLDDEIVAGPGLVSGHARWHDTEQDLVVLGYMPIAPPQPGRRWSAATRLYAESYERACDAFDRDPDSILLGIWGGNISVRREHWLRALELEGLAVTFPHVDREFGLRLRQLGLSGRFDRSLQAVHHDERDIGRLADDARGSALSQLRFHRAYPELIPLPPGPQSRAARLMVRAVLALTRPPRIWGRVVTLLVRLVGVAQARGLLAAEYALTRLVWRLAYERARAEAS